MIKRAAEMTLTVFKNIETNPETNSFMANVYHLKEFDSPIFFHPIVLVILSNTFGPPSAPLCSILYDRIMNLNSTMYYAGSNTKHIFMVRSNC